VDEVHGEADIVKKKKKKPRLYIMAKQTCPSTGQVEEALEERLDHGKAIL